MTTIREYIDQSEKLREQGALSDALVSIDNAIAFAGEEANYVELLEAMAHKLEIWKFFHTKTQQAVFWELLKGDAITGLHIAEAYNIHGHPRAVMLLRRGTYDMFHKNYNSAVEWFKKAYSALPASEQTGTRAEFLGHLGEAEGSTGNEEGVAHLEQALAEVKASTDIRPFHKMVIESGIHLRAARVSMVLRRERDARVHWEQAKNISEILSKEHNMPARLAQCHKFAEAFNLF